MNNKKKYLKILRKDFRLIVVGLSIIISSCSDSILDLKPLDAISEEDVFNDEVLLADYVTGLYRSFDTFYFGTYYTEGMSDNIYAPDLSFYNRGEITEDNAELGSRSWQWATKWVHIKNANLFFDRIENSQANADVVKRLTAEARFIRAYIYFDLTRYYGGVPLITSSFELGGSFEVQRNTYDEVINFVITELDLAIPDLPVEDFGANNGRASRGSAMALKSRTLLYAASAFNNPGNNQDKWIAARDAAKATLDLPEYSLDPSYANLFTETVSNEHIFARRFTNNNHQTQDVFPQWNIGSSGYFLPKGIPDTHTIGAWFVPLQDFIDSYEMIDGELPETSILYDPNSPYQNRDPRFYSTISYHGATVGGQLVQYHVDETSPGNSSLAGPHSFQNGGSQSSYNIIKMADSTKARWLGPEPHLIPWVFFRKAEIYLNYAEACIALGEDEEAREAINAVRSRASVNMPPVVESGNDLLEKYRNERRIELAIEDHRWFDLVRWEIAKDKLNQPAIGMRITRNSTTGVETYTKDLVVDNSRLWMNKMSLFPIPREEIERSNFSLVQNPDY